MYKKIICLGVLLAVVFSLFACITPNNELAAYKAEAKTGLDAYAESKGQENYTVENWAVINELVAESKTTIDTTRNKAAVDAAVEMAKNAIDTISQKEENVPIGTFYSLQEAYDKGLLTVQDLRSIAYYYHNTLEWDIESEGLYDGLKSTDYIPISKTPETLSVETTNRIKQDFINYVKCNDAEHDVQIRYYGTYNGCVSTMIDGCLDYLAVVQLDIVDGITFYYGSNREILIWMQV